jgi:hypothetical protein
MRTIRACDAPGASASSAGIAANAETAIFLIFFLAASLVFCREDNLAPRDAP